MAQHDEICICHLPNPVHGPRLLALRAGLQPVSGQVSQVGLRDDDNGTMMVSIAFPSLTAAEACATRLQGVPLVPGCISYKHVRIALARLLHYA
jgi:hypothetical protein